ncbi:MAG: hypothetical protein ACI4XP_06430 [Acutalibacteraceae bacterium]
MNDNENIKRKNTSGTQPYKQHTKTDDKQLHTDKIKNQATKSVPVRLKVKKVHKDEVSQSENIPSDSKVIDESKDIKPEHKSTDTENKNSQYQPPVQQTPPQNQPYQSYSPQYQSNQQYQQYPPQYQQNQPYQQYPQQYQQNQTNQKQSNENDSIQNKLKRIIKKIISFIVAHKKGIIALLSIEAVWIMIILIVIISNNINTEQNTNKNTNTNTNTTPSQSYSYTNSISENSKNHNSKKKYYIDDKIVGDHISVTIDQVYTEQKYGQIYVKVDCSIYNKSGGNWTFWANDSFKLNNDGVIESGFGLDYNYTELSAGATIKNTIQFMYSESANTDFDKMVLTIDGIDVQVANKPVNYESSTQSYSVTEQSVSEPSVTENNSDDVVSKNMYIDDNENFAFNIYTVNIKSEEKHSNYNNIEFACDIYNKTDKPLSFNSADYFKMNNKGIMATATSESDNTTISAGSSLKANILFKYKVSANTEFDYMILTVSTTEVPIISDIKNYTYDEFCGTYYWDGTTFHDGRMIISPLYDDYYNIVFVVDSWIYFYTVKADADKEFTIPQKGDNYYKWIPDEHMIGLYKNKDDVNTKEPDGYYRKIKKQYLQ